MCNLLGTVEAHPHPIPRVLAGFGTTRDNTRVDTRPNRKIRIRIRRGKYKEHWRHIRFDTCEQMWEKFQSSGVYATYLNKGGLPREADLLRVPMCLH